jgi:RNA polymerase sigma-70 factor (ECF subfamily)
MRDSELIRRCLAGDIEAYGDLVRIYQRAALTQAALILRNEAEAQEVVQDCFLRTYERLAQFDCERPFFPWFRAILKNDCLKRLHRGRREIAEQKSEFYTADTGTSPVLQLEIQDILAKMSAEDREILLLKHVEGYSYDEISEQLAIPRGTVMSRLYTARVRFKDLLQEGVSSNDAM